MYIDKQEQDNISLEMLRKFANSTKKEQDIGKDER